MTVPRTLAAAVTAALITAGCGTPSPRAYFSEPMGGKWRIAVIPPTNYTEDSTAPDRVAAVIASELPRIRPVEVVDPGVVEDVLSREPWLLTDRIPPDLVDKLGEAMGANALLVGSVLANGYRQEAWGESVPEFAVSLRLLEVPGGKLIWSASHSRDGSDGETLFGIGRVSTLEQLVSLSLEEVLDTLPPVAEVGNTVTTAGSQGEKP